MDNNITMDAMIGCLGRLGASAPPEEAALTIPLARYRFNCPYCGKETWGQTNLEDPEITTRCKCGGNVKLRWDSKAKEYQAITKGEQEYE